MTHSWQIAGYEHLELSTQILLQHATARGIAFEVLDAHENIVRLTQGAHSEIVKQASITRLDDIITWESMTFKAVTKKLLSEANVPVPVGGVFTEMSPALEAAQAMQTRFVIKPESTNYGTAVHFANPGEDPKTLEWMITDCLDRAPKVLVEGFVKGDEYRFTVIDGAIAGVFQRIPAHVEGDGVLTVSALVDAKNAADPLRGPDYSYVRQFILKNDAETHVLAEQNLTWESVPAVGVRVWLRRNSNISTGGDSHELTPIASESLKQLAIDAAAVVRASICGVDIITEDIHGDHGTIIELNWNPAIMDHSYPSFGTPNPVADKVLDALGFAR